MLDELWQEFQKETKQYKDSTEERKLRFEALKKKDDESARTIARQMRKLQKLQDTISVLKQRMASNAKESEMKTSAIKEVSVQCKRGMGGGLRLILHVVKRSTVEPSYCGHPW